MLVRATQRGHFQNRIIEAGETFDCPPEEVALVMLGPAGEQLGWMQPVQWAPLKPIKLRRTPDASPAAAGHSLWPPGGDPESEQNKKLAKPGMFRL
jgi:hypothetical protein